MGIHLSVSLCVMESMCAFLFVFVSVYILKICVHVLIGVYVCMGLYGYTCVYS